MQCQRGDIQLSEITDGQVLGEDRRPLMHDQLGHAIVR